MDILTLGLGRDRGFVTFALPLSVDLADCISCSVLADLLRQRSVLFAIQGFQVSDTHSSKVGRYEVSRRRTDRTHTQSPQSGARRTRTHENEV